MTRNARNFTVKMTPTDGSTAYYPAAPGTGGDHTTNKARAQRMTRAHADLFVQRVALFVSTITASVESL